MQNFEFKNNFIGYFRFYYGVLGYRIILYLFLNIAMGLLDGLGLTMFIPLLQVAGGDMSQEKANASMGGMHYIVDFMQGLGLPLSLGSVLLILVVLFTLKGICRYIQLIYFAYLRQRFIKAFRHGLMDRLEHLTYTGFLQLDAGRIQNTFIAEVNRMFNTFANYFESFQSMVLLVTYLAMAFSANYQFAFFVIIGGLVSNFIYRYIYKATKNASIEVSRKGHDFNSFLLQAVTYFKYLKSTNYLGVYARKVRRVINETEDINFRLGRYSAIIQSIREPLLVLIVSAVIYMQINLLHGNLSSIILSLLLFYRALQYLMDTQSHWQQFISNVGGMVVVGELWNQMNGLEEPEHKAAYRESLKHLEVKGLHFAYGEKEVLHDIHLQVDRNQTIAFVGESGSGKSTLVNLLTGLLAPNCGQVLVNGIDLQTIDSASFRSRIGYISQEPVIFNDTIFNNVTFWADKTPETIARFWKTLKMASLFDFVQDQDNKEDARLGDNGMLVSGGQKQRISIARELYKNVELLILDEATSALDSETEQIIKENIDSLQGKYTMVIIAHRLSTIKNADCIYLLENGSITGKGDFQTLTHVSERFGRMVALQEV